MSSSSVSLSWLALLFSSSGRLLGQLLATAMTVDTDSTSQSSAVSYLASLNISYRSAVPDFFTRLIIKRTWRQRNVLQEEGREWTRCVQQQTYLDWSFWPAPFCFQLRFFLSLSLSFRPEMLSGACVHHSLPVSKSRQKKRENPHTHFLTYFSQANL